MRLGIDFGTCYSSAALMLNGTLKLVKEPLFRKDSSLPSSIFVKQDEDKIFVGQAAERQRRLDPECYWREFKRDLGRTEPSKLGNRQILPEEAISEIIRTLKTEAERMVTEPLTGAVITVPANYQSYKQQLMEQAARQAGFSDVEIITEPVAAAIYHARKGGGERTMKDGDIILVYDLGGGTFDAALIQKRGGGFELLAQPVGDEQCGGIDFDRQIYADLKGRCSEIFRELLDLKRQDVSALRTRLMVWDWCREFKHQLSTFSQHEDVLPQGTVETYSLSRVDFEGKIEPFISKTCNLCSQLVTEAGIKWEQVNQVLMVGGSCQIPYVRQRLEREFARPVVRVDEPDLAVCLGAAIYANEQIEQQRLEAEIKVKAEQDRLRQQQLESERLTAEIQAKTERDRQLQQQQLEIARLEAEIAARAEQDRRQQAFEQELQRRETVKTQLLQTQAESWQCIQTFKHDTAVRCIAISPNDRVLVSGNDDSTIEIRDLSSGNLIRTIYWKKTWGDSEASWVTAIAISPDGKTIASGNLSKLVKLWDLNSGKLIRNYQGHSDSIHSLAFSPDGQILVSGSRDKTIKTWDVNMGKTIATFKGHSDPISSVAISPNGKTIVSGSRDRQIKIWDLLSGNSLANLSQDSDWVRSIAISPNGKVCASGSSNRKIEIWDLARRSLLHTLSGHRDWINSIAISPDGNTLISGSKDTDIKLWKIDNGEQIATLTDHLQPLSCVAFSSDGNTIASSSEDGVIKIWKKSSNRV